MNTRKSLFGPFNIWIDEAGHVILSLIVAFIGALAGLNFLECAIVFLSGAFLIDLDHYLDIYLLKKYLKKQEFEGRIGEGYAGYAPFVLHGFDIAIIISIIAGSVGGALFGWMLFLALALHIIWDFLVYPHHHSHLTLAHRARKGFRAEKRDYLVGRIFDADSLK